jgi:hypothetical protein
LVSDSLSPGREQAYIQSGKHDCVGAYPAGDGIQELICCVEEMIESKFFGCVSDNRFFVKITEPGEVFMPGGSP